MWSIYCVSFDFGIETQYILKLLPGFFAKHRSFIKEFESVVCFPQIPLRGQALRTSLLRQWTPQLPHDSFVNIDIELLRLEFLDHFPFCSFCCNRAQSPLEIATEKRPELESFGPSCILCIVSNF